MNPKEQQFIVATPGHSMPEDHARALKNAGRLRFIAMGTRRGAPGIPPEQTRLLPAFGLANYIMANTFSISTAESLRLRMHPWFDYWIKKQLTPRDHIISSYGYANESFKWVRANGGRTFLDGGNSHPENVWNILSKEHKRWNSPLPPMPEHHYRRSMAMMPDVDFVISPSSYVTQSFLTRGFKPEQILRNVYPVNLSTFTPAREPRPKNRPLTVVNTGSLSLRKGSPYVLEAFRIVRKKIPDARLLLTRIIQDDTKHVLSSYSDLPVEWSPPLPHGKLAERLCSADIFVLPSLEDGFARTVTEALACGLPVITTPNTGASDLIRPGTNGEVVPIRNPQAIADAILKWAEKILSENWQPRVLLDAEAVSFEHFEREFIRQLHALGLA